MTPPVVLWLPCLVDSATDQVVYEAGAFTTEEEAQKVLDIWHAEGRTEPMALNIVHFYETSGEWVSDR